MNICGFLAVEVDAVWKASKFKGGLLFSLLILHLFFPSCSFLLIHNLFTDSSLPVIIVVASRGNYENQATVLEGGKALAEIKSWIKGRMQEVGMQEVHHGKRLTMEYHRH